MVTDTDLGAKVCLPIPLLLILDEESREAKLDGFSMMREFDKLSFLVKFEMVRNLDWTEGAL